MSSEYHIELSILVSLPSWPVAALHEKYLWGDQDEAQPDIECRFFSFSKSFNSSIIKFMVVSKYSDSVDSEILRQVFCIMMGDIRMWPLWSL